MTNAIFARSKALTEYRIVDVPAGAVDLHTLGEHHVGTLTVEVVDPVHGYVELMKQLYDFDALRAFVAAHPTFTFLFDAMSGGKTDAADARRGAAARVR